MLPLVLPVMALLLVGCACSGDTSNRSEREDAKKPLSPEQNLGPILTSSKVESYLKCGKELMDDFPTLRGQAEAYVKNSSVDAWEAKELTIKENDKIGSFAKGHGFASGQELVNVNERVWECWKDEHTKWRIAASVRSAEEAIKKIEAELMKPGISDDDRKNAEFSLKFARAFNTGPQNPTYQPKSPPEDLAAYVEFHERFKGLALSLGAYYEE